MLSLIRKSDIQHSSKVDDAFRRYIAEILPTKRQIIRIELIISTIRFGEVIPRLHFKNVISL